jgi:hypothetical protein
MTGPGTPPPFTALDASDSHFAFPGPRGSRFALEFGHFCDVP